MWLTRIALFLMVVVAPALAQPQRQAPLGEAQADYNAGQYRPCLQKIARAMSDARPGTPERYDLLMLRGNALLQLKEQSLALDAFEAAARSVKGQGDLKRMADARAMGILVKASPGLKYKPTNGEAISITADSRTEALKALLDDRLTALEPKVAKATEGTSLVPMRELLPSIADVMAVELAATGDMQRSLPLGKTMGERARNLMSEELTRLQERVNSIYDMATEPSLLGGAALGYRGLTTPERDELKQMAQYVAQIKAAAADGRRINKFVGGTGEVWDGILANCDDVMERIKQAGDRAY